VFGDSTLATYVGGLVMINSSSSIVGDIAPTTGVNGLVAREAMP